MVYLCFRLVCPDGYFIGYDDGCYKLGMTPMSWKNARLDCASEIDSDLVNIETADENELLRGLLGDSDSYWISMDTPVCFVLIN